MKVVLRPNLRDLWRGRVTCGHLIGDAPEELVALSGKTMEVDTQFLFQDQFNLVEPSAPRILTWMVDHIVDDARPGKMRCQFCGACGPVADACAGCGNNGWQAPTKNPVGMRLHLVPLQDFISVDEYHSPDRRALARGHDWLLYAACSKS